MNILRFLTGCTLVSLGHCWMVKVPNTVKAVDGSCVEVSCHTAPHHRVIWYRYHSVLYPKVYDGKEPTSVETSFRGHTSVPGNASEGDCTLRVESVTWTDNNLQLYVWINPDESATQNVHHQIVRITIENRKAPVLSMKNALVDGDLFQAKCTVWHSCPSSPPTLHKSRLPVNSTAVTSMEENGGLWVSTETIQGRGTCQLHKKEMKCTAQFATVQTESQPVILNISYAPVGVKVMVDEQPVSEGHSVNLECVVDSNPQPGRENMVSAEVTGPLERRPNVSCVASNSLATDIQQLPLDTKFTAGQLLPWMLTALAVGSVFLWGAVMFVHRIRCRERPKASSNLPTLDIPLRDRCVGVRADPHQLQPVP
ncbi:myelin-associated glycoprotein-like isoform 2-T3 [Salvelinus alpinus]